MEILDKLKIWYECKNTGRTKEYEEYKIRKEAKKKDIDMFRRYLNSAVEKFTEIQKNFGSDTKEYINAKNNVYRLQYDLDEALLSLKFIRPNSNQDIEYRNYQCDNFAKELQSVVSPNLDLRFHGTPIYFAEKIIKEGKITSTADRYEGYIKSTDIKGEISASTVKTIGRTIEMFSDTMAYLRSLPCGCIFALFTDKNDKTKYLPDSMHSVDFKKSPEQLFGIFTSPENIEQVKKWLKESKMDSSLVYTFEEFLEVAKEKSNEIDKQYQFRNSIEVDNSIELKSNSELESNNEHNQNTIQENTEFTPESIDIEEDRE